VFESATVGCRVEAAAVGLIDLLVAVPNIADTDNVDELAVILHIEQVADVRGHAAAAGPEDGEVDALVGAFDARADGGVGQ
jgi:hypothetical protein